MMRQVQEHYIHLCCARENGTKDTNDIQEDLETSGEPEERKERDWLEGRSGIVCLGLHRQVFVILAGRSRRKGVHVDGDIMLLI